MCGWISQDTVPILHRKSQDVTRSSSLSTPASVRQTLLFMLLLMKSWSSSPSSALGLSVLPHKHNEGTCFVG